MNDLQIVSFDGVEAVDSRDIAVMVERDHNELLKSIRIYSKYLAEGEVPQRDFFIESTYFNSNGQEYPNFLITKKGCDLIANKMIGKKGILFTAAYVNAFERMRKQTAPAPMSPAQLIAAQAQLLVDMERRMDEMQGQARALEAKVDTAIKAFARPAEDHWRGDMDRAVKELCADIGWSLPKLQGKLYAELEERQTATSTPVCPPCAAGRKRTECATGTHRPLQSWTLLRRTSSCGRSMKASSGRSRPGRCPPERGRRYETDPHTGRDPELDEGNRGVGQGYV